MSNPGHTRPGGLRPQFKTLADGRQQAVTFFKLSSGEQVTTDLILPWGGLYSAIEGVKTTGKKAHLAGLRLIGGQEARQMQGGGDWVWVREYEELHATNETQVGKNRRRIGDDGRVEIVADFIQLSSAARTPGTVAVTTAPAPDAAAGVMASEDPQDDGAVRRIQRVYVAAGILSKSERDVGDGMKDVTWVSVLTKQSPTFGALRQDDVRNPDGLPVYTVTKRQSAAGGDPTGISISVPRDVPFKYPTRVKPFIEIFNSRTMLDLYTSPGETVNVPATVTISYTTSDTLGTVTPARWNPKSGAVLRAQWVGLRNEPVNQVRALPGCRAVFAAPDTDAREEVTAGIFAPVDVSCMGNTVYGGTTARIIVAGGPPDPAGNSYTLFIELEPVFKDMTGTQYYRKTQITATIPAEDALPV